MILLLTSLIEGLWWDTNGWMWMWPLLPRNTYFGTHLSSIILMLPLLYNYVSLKYTENIPYPPLIGVGGSISFPWEDFLKRFLRKVGLIWRDNTTFLSKTKRIEKGWSHLRGTPIFKYRPQHKIRKRFSSRIILDDKIMFNVGHIG